MKINMNYLVTVTLNQLGRSAFMAYVRDEAGADIEFEDMLDEYDYDVDTNVLTVPMFELVNIFGTGNPDTDHMVYFESNSLEVDAELTKDLLAGLKEAIDKIRDINKAVAILVGGKAQYRQPVTDLLERLVELRDRAVTELKEHA